MHIILHNNHPPKTLISPKISSSVDADLSQRVRSWTPPAAPTLPPLISSTIGKSSSAQLENSSWCKIKTLQRHSLISIILGNKCMVLKKQTKEKKAFLKASMATTVHYHRNRGVPEPIKEFKNTYRAHQQGHHK